MIQQQASQRTSAITSVDFTWILEPSSEQGGLGIGNYRLASNHDHLNKLQIVAVISVFGEKQISIPEGKCHFRILIGDSPSENIQCFFKTSYSFINQKIKKGNVLVHCQAGVSRSATIVLAYLIKKNNWNLENAIKFVKDKRPYIQPNKGFMKQLRNYSQQITKQKKRILSNFIKQYVK